MKNILLGVTGGIAAYKSANIVSMLKKNGYNVKVIMSENATKIITPLTLETLSKERVMWICGIRLHILKLSIYL